MLQVRMIRGTQVDLSGQVFKHLGQPAKPPQEEGAGQDT